MGTPNFLSFFEYVKLLTVAHAPLSSCPGCAQAGSPWLILIATPYFSKLRRSMLNCFNSSQGGSELEGFENRFRLVVPLCATVMQRDQTEVDFDWRSKSCSTAGVGLTAYFADGGSLWVKSATFPWPRLCL